jgi:uncharacterized membrane protein
VSRLRRPTLTPRRTPGIVAIATSSIGKAHLTYVLTCVCMLVRLWLTARPRHRNKCEFDKSAELTARRCETAKVAMISFDLCEDTLAWLD